MRLGPPTIPEGTTGAMGQATFLCVSSTAQPKPLLPEILGNDCNVDFPY